MAIGYENSPSGLREALAWALANAKPRDPLLDARDGSGRMWLYNDTTHTYDAIDQWHKTGREVSNIDSFAALVVEVINRQDEQDSPPRAGRGSSVLFSDAGAVFRPNDHDPRVNHVYARKSAPQWSALAAACGRPMEHLVFVRTLQALRPSMPQYARVIQDFRKIDFGTSSSLRSNPFLEEGKAGVHFSFQIEVKGGVQDTHLPNAIDFVVPFARGGEKTFNVRLELDITVKDEGDKKKPVFTLCWPDLAATYEEAVNEEIAWFEGEMRDAGLARLLVLRNL